MSVPQWMRSVIRRELSGIEPATIFREELERELAQLRAENERLHAHLLEMLVALRDSLKQSQDAFLVGFQEAMTGKSGGAASGVHDKLLRRRPTSQENPT